MTLRFRSISAMRAALGAGCDAHRRRPAPRTAFPPAEPDAIAPVVELTLLPVRPRPKPRMTQRDRWQKRPCVLEYRAFRDEVRFHLRGRRLPDRYVAVFVLPMPASWTEEKRAAHRGRAHTQKPDRDNLEKALLDALGIDDAPYWDGHTMKIWGDVGCILIQPADEVAAPVDPAALLEAALLGLSTKGVDRAVGT